MKKSMILAIVGMAMSMSVHAQVQFSKFKFYVADIIPQFGIRNSA